MSSPFLSHRDAVAPQDLIDRAKRFAPPRVAIARAGAPLPMEAAEDATKVGIMTPVFVGEPDMIRAEAAKLDWDISAYEIHATTGEEEAGRTAAAAAPSRPLKIPTSLSSSTSIVDSSSLISFGDNG